MTSPLLVASPAVDPSVAFVAVAGYWTAGQTRGTYRVVVWDEGFEHVSSGVRAEWVAEPSDSQAEAQVVSSRQLVEPGFFSFGAPRLTRHGAGVRVVLDGVDTHEPDRRVSCSFDLLPDRRVSTVKPCAGLGH